MNEVWFSTQPLSKPRVSLSASAPCTWNPIYCGTLYTIVYFDCNCQTRLQLWAFADNIATVSVAKTVKDIEEKTNIAIRKGTVGLALAANETDAVLISDRKIVEKMKVTVAGTKIESKSSIKYLEVTIEDRLKLQGARKIHRGKGIYNPGSTDEDTAKYWRIESI